MFMESWCAQLHTVLGKGVGKYFRRCVLEFNAGRITMPLGEYITLDESMISWRPQTSKTGGLPNISFIKRKPKPLGIDLKNGVDSDSGVMICAEIQEGNWAEGSSLANAPRARQVGHDGKAHRRVEKYALRISRMRIQRRARRRRAGVREAYMRR